MEGGRECLGIVCSQDPDAVKTKRKNGDGWENVCKVCIYETDNVENSLGIHLSEILA